MKNRTFVYLYQFFSTPWYNPVNCLCCCLQRLPKGPNLSQEQQLESQKALLQQMNQGLMQMLQADKAQRTALKQADLHQQIENVSQQVRASQQHLVGNMGDKRGGQGPGGSTPGAGGNTGSTSSGGAFQKYPVQPPQ